MTTPKLKHNLIGRLDLLRKKVGGWNYLDDFDELSSRILLHVHVVTLVLDAKWFAGYLFDS